MFFYLYLDKRYICDLSEGRGKCVADDHSLCKIEDGSHCYKTYVECEQDGCHDHRDGDEHKHRR